MSIVVRPTADAPLSQGDILQGVPLVFTDPDGKPNAVTKATYVLVVSRRCDAIRTDFVTVAPVVAHPVNLSEFRNRIEGDAKGERAKRKPGEVLDRLRRYLSGIRDGGQHSDAFYLGNLDEADNKRFAAQLQTLFTVQIPIEAVSRGEYLQRHRVWRLSDEFIHDLHSRLFTSYARLGFDDHEWFSDPDLDVMITHGEAEIGKRELEVAAVRKTIHEKEASNEAVNQSIQKQLVAREDELQKEKEALEPYLKERRRRGR